MFYTHKPTFSMKMKTVWKNIFQILKNKLMILFLLKDTTNGLYSDYIIFKSSIFIIIKY